MRHAGRIAVLLVAIAAPAGLAQEPSTAPPRIGVVDIAAVVSGYARTATLEAELQAERERVKVEVEAASERLRRVDRGGFRRDGHQEDWLALRDRLRQADHELEQLQERRQAELVRRVEAALEQLLADVEAAVAAQARASGLGLVLRLDRGGGPGGELGRALRERLGPPRRDVLFAEPALDCTQAVLARLTSRGAR